MDSQQPENISRRTLLGGGALGVFSFLFPDFFSRAQAADISQHMDEKELQRILEEAAKRPFTQN